MNKIEFELGGMLARRDIDQMGLETANKSLENRHQLDMKEITRLTNENHRLRAALVSSELNASVIVGDSPRDAFKVGINTLRDAVRGDGHDIDMSYIARYNHDKIDINEVK